MFVRQFDLKDCKAILWFPKRGGPELTRGIVVYVMPEYPARTQTFVENEAKAVSELGMGVERYALRRGGGEQLRFELLRNLSNAVARAGIKNVIAITVNIWRHRLEMLKLVLLPPRDLKSVSRQLYAICHAVILALRLLRLENPSVYVHAHFLGRAFEVAMFAKMLVPKTIRFSATAHATDAAAPDSIARLSANVKQLDVLVGASEFVSQKLRENTGRSADLIVHCGIEPAGPREGRGSTCRCTKNSINILTVARLVPKKGLADCIDAARLMAENNTEFEWRIVGDGPEKSKLLTMIDQLGLQKKVQLVGHQDHAVVLEALTNWADIFVLASRPDISGDIDGIPVSLMEAMTRELPVISTNTAGIPELIEHSVTGLLVSPNSAGDLAAAIEYLIDADTSNELAAAAKRFVDSNFSQAGEARKLMTMFGATV